MDELGFNGGEERVAWYFGDAEVSVVQRSVVEVDEDVVVSEGWDVGFVVELETVEAVLALDSPLFGRWWHHYDCLY